MDNPRTQTPASLDASVLELREKLAQAQTEAEAQRQRAQTAEQALRDMEDRFLLLSELLSDSASSTLLGKNGELIREWHIDRLIRTYGYTFDDIDTVEKWRTIVHPDDQPRFDESVASLLRNGKVDNELRIVTRSGEVRWISHRIRVAPDHRTTLPRLISAVTDITERKLAEQSILESRANLLALIESTDDLIWAVNKDKVVTSYNSAFKEHIARRYGVEITLGMDASQLVLAEALPFWFDLHASALRGEKSSRELSLSNGEHLEIYANPIVTGQHITGVSAFARNTTARRLAERALRDSEAQLLQAQKMESIGQLAGGMAHDINNLLTPILAYSQMLRDATGDSDPRHCHLSEVNHAAVRIRDLVSQLLAFSRKQVLEPRIVDLSAVVSGFEMMLRRTIREDIGIEVCLPAAPVLVKADVRQLEQVILNLAVNAQDAMANGGVLSISVSQFDKEHPVDPEVALGEAECVAVLSVRDTGHGIDDAIIDHLFEPFFTTKPTEQGTGLGLATVYGIAQQHGGHATAKNAPDKGAVFEVVLPAFCDEPLFVAPQADDIAPTPGRTAGLIMVVEDNDLVREVTQQTLEFFDYRVMAVESAARCLEVAGDLPEPIGLLITDVVMPGMNGRLLYEALVQSRPELPVLYMSGYDRNVLAQLSSSQPGVHFLQKPFDSKALLGKVTEIFAESRD